MIKKVSLPKLMKESFLIVPAPLKEELFSSWFARLAYAHYTHPQTFINLHFGLAHRGEFKNNIDTTLSIKVLTQIQEKCKNKIDILNLTLKTYSGYLQENDISIMSNRLLCSVKFCPKCLKEDTIPYFRKKWKFAFSTACIKHNCYLHESCPKCKEKIEILKMYQNKLSDIYCHSCGYDLKKSSTQYIPRNYSYGIKAIKKINSTLDKGYITFNGIVVYSFCFFDALVQLVKLILIKRHIKFINMNPLFKLLKHALKRKLNSAKSLYMQLSIKEKYALFGIIIYLFENYPNNFKKYILANNLSHWDMVKEIKYLSFWYENLVNNITPKYVAFGDMITDKEIENGKRYLISHGLEISKANLSRLFGNINFFSNMSILHI